MEALTLQANNRFCLYVIDGGAHKANLGKKFCFSISYTEIFSQNCLLIFKVWELDDLGLLWFGHVLLWVTVCKRLGKVINKELLLIQLDAAVFAYRWFQNVSSKTACGSNCEVMAEKTSSRELSPVIQLHSVKRKMVKMAEWYIWRFKLILMHGF